VVDRQLLHLRLDGVVDLGPAVADVDRPEAGEGVDVLVALGVVHDRALGVVHDDRLEAFELRERRPEVAEEVVLEAGLAGVVERLGHGSSRRAGRATQAGRRARRVKAHAACGAVRGRPGA